MMLGREQRDQAARSS